MTRPTCTAPIYSVLQLQKVVNGVSGMVFLEREAHFQ